MTMDEFVEGILRCKGPARAMDQARGLCFVVGQKPIVDHFGKCCPSCFEECEIRKGWLVPGSDSRRARQIGHETDKIDAPWIAS